MLFRSAPRRRGPETIRIRHENEMEFLLEYGYIGLFLGAFLAATILPMSSDVLLVGLLAVGADPYIAVAVATAGNWLGGLTSYWLGRAGKWEWLEKYCKVKRATIEKHQHRVTRYGSLLAFFTWLPLIGDVMAIALGPAPTFAKPTKYGSGSGLP